MISRSQIKALQAHREYPSVSILAPTHRSAPDNRKDPIKVKNLVEKAVDRLHDEFPKREVAPIVKNLKGLVAAVKWRHTFDGLALFASRDTAESYTLPFKVKPRAMIDETFATRDLVYSVNRAAPYRVLLLSHESRLFDGWTTQLDEHTAKPFPMIHRGRGGAARLPGGQGVNRSAVRDEAQRTYFKGVDEALSAVQKTSALPIVLVGVERNLAYFQEVTRNKSAIIGVHAGNHERTSPSDLGKLVWPVADSAFAMKRMDALVQLDQAVSMRRSASGLDQVWRAAIAGKCRTLLVEKDFKHPADVNTAGDRLLAYTGKGANALDDAVDELVEHVMAGGGDVHFLASGDLALHQRIAAVLRR